MANAAIGCDVLQSLDIEEHFSPEVSLDAMTSFDDGTNSPNLVFIELVGSLRRINLRLSQDFSAQAQTDAVDVRKGVLDAFVTWEEYSGDANCHD